MEVILSLAERAVVFHQGKVIAAGRPARRGGGSGGGGSAYLGHHMKRVRR